MPHRHDLPTLLAMSLLLVATLLLATGCTGMIETDAEVRGQAQTFDLTSSQRTARLTQIRDAGAGAGMTMPVLLAGVAESETHLAHCWSEATWACKGPASSSCGGGPVIAGSGDGACSLQQGGLGMFQFDAGTYTQTLAREGQGILTVEGNTAAAVRFVTNMVVNSQYIPARTSAEALAWLNAMTFRDIQTRSPRHQAWIKTVVHYYNGCVPGRCSVYDERIARYTGGLDTVLNEKGIAFWTIGGQSDAQPGDEDKAPIMLDWTHHAENTHFFTAQPPASVDRVVYSVDGYTIGAATREDGPDFFTIYSFRNAGEGRKVRAVGYTRAGEAVALGVGMLDARPEWSMDILQQRAGEYTLRLSNEPEGVAWVDFSIDQYKVFSGSPSARYETTISLNQLGPRVVAMTTYNADGSVRGTVRRTFTFR